MAERKCSNCGIVGHTKTTCLRFHDAQEISPTEAAQIEELAELEAMEQPEDVIVKGPWHGAHNAGRCTWCGDRYAEGDSIRSDGQGGWECRCVDGEQDDRDGNTGANWKRPTAANVQMPPAVGPVPPEAMFASPVAVDESFGSPVAVDGGDAGEKRTERLGYICKDPVLGDFRRYKKGTKQGITRATTFNKSASNSKAITDWNKRNIIVGASRRPDIVAQAHGMDVSLNVKELMAIADQLEDAAGGNVASAMGTEIHKWTELIDAGEAKLDDVPPHYRGPVSLYIAALKEHGFRVVPELRERTTYIEEFGGVAGTFDAILHHVPTDTYRISDTKTGKSMDHGWPEIECQEWIYGYGYNRFGTYNWDTHEWEPPKYHVSMDYGLVIHLPVAGPLAGTCQVLRTDLDAGAEHAKLCHQVRSGGKSKPVPWTSPAPDPAARSWGTFSLGYWTARFGRVSTVAEAGQLWEEARADHVPPDALGELVKTAQDTLRALGVQG